MMQVVWGLPGVYEGFLHISPRNGGEGWGEGVLVSGRGGTGVQCGIAHGSDRPT